MTMAGLQTEDNQKSDTDIKMKPPKEHGSLGYLLSQIPRKAQKGILVQCDLIMTCLDANQEYIVIGTNIGILFLYDRKKTIMEKLKTGSNNDNISCVSLHDGLEHQVAAGTTKGCIYIFQLPSIMPGKNKQLHKFDVSNMHKSSLTCLSWSINGMKLFSGDDKGHVICTEVDFYQGQCKSTELLIEVDTDIVQLHHAHKCLLVSTRHRTVVCRTDDQDQLVQIGQKERKIPGPFGGIFIPRLCKTDDAQLYAVRPGMRIWQAGVDGTVQATYLFKELISNPHPEITLLYNESSSTSAKSVDLQFGCVLLYMEKYLVTWNKSAVYILNPADHEVIGSQNKIGIVKSVAVTNDEIFVLRQNTDRNLIRIAVNPENRESVYEKLIQEKRLADAAARNLMSSDISIEVKSSSSTSPFKFFQTNIVDKIKNLDVTSATKTDSKSVTHLKESMDKFGHVDSDTGDEEELHHHHHHHHHGKSNNQVNLSNDIPPVIKPVSELKGDLPPIVTLDSSDLLTVELFSGIPSNVSKAVEPLSPGSERFNPFMKDNLSDFEEDGGFTHDIKLTFQETNKSSSPGTVRKISEQDSEQDKSEDKPDSSIPKPLSDRLTKDVLNKNDDDDIVFSVKPKHRKVKKKKGHKNKPKIEDDRQSTASAEEISIGSDSPLVGRKISIDSTGNDSPEVDRKISHDSDSISVKSDISDKSIDVHTADSSSPHTSPALLHNTGKSKQNKDVFSRIEENLDSLEGLEKHLTKFPTDKISQPYLKNFENRACISGNVDVDKEMFKDTNEQNLQKSIGNAAQVHAETVKSTNSHKNNVLSEETDPNKTSLEKTSEENIDSKTDTTEDSAINKPMIRTERSLSVEDSIYSKYSTNRETEVAHVKDSDEDNEKLLQKVEESDLSLINSPDSEKTSKKQYYQTPDSSLDDFYHKFGSTHSNLSVTEDNTPPQSIPTVKDKQEVESQTDVLNESEIAPSYKLVNNWTEIQTMGNLLSLSLTNSHVWNTDRFQNIYYSSLSRTGIKWQKVNGFAKQIAVSRSGYIVWRLYKDTVYVGTRVTAKRPEGLKWEEAIREVQYIAVTDSSAWYIKANGDIMMQKGLTKERPCFKGKKVACSYLIKQIICQTGVVWGLTDKYKIVYRKGITKSCVEGTDWTLLQTDLLFSCISFGDGNCAWAIDVLGRICFTTNVTMETPAGEGKWWQVPMSEIIVQDVTAIDALRSLAKKFDPQKLAYIMSTTIGGLICAGSGGIWVCPEYKNILQICRGSMEGHFWEEVILSGISTSMVWKSICASSSDHQYGLVWSQQPNGDLFTFSPDSDKCNMVSQPLSQRAFISLSSCKEAIWGLSEEGHVYIRGGLRSSCPQGTDWIKLDTSQLGDVHFISLSCGSQSVWAVDCDGIVFQRLGVKAPSSHSLPSVWLQVDHIQTGTVFTQVVSGANDWMVWALDNRRQVYARIGITDAMPIGTEWVHVPGTPATQITISNTYVWALNPNGEILCRYGVTEGNPGGDYWRQIPGIFIQISTSPNDRLWAISREGKIYKRHTKYLIRRQQSNDPLFSGNQRLRSAASTSSDDGWELV